MRKMIYELGMIFYLLPLYLIMLVIDAGLVVSKKLIGLTGWRVFKNIYSLLHICGEKLSRHIHRMIPM